MTSNYLLSSRDYTIYNAFTWGNCLAHYRRAYAAESRSQRMFHGAAALVEFVPIISQIASLSEIAVAYVFRPSPLANKEIRHIELQEPELLHQAGAPLAMVDIALPTQVENLNEALFPLHRHIERQYRNLPWPAQLRNIVVLTKVCKGLGDVVAAAKAIDVMQRLSPSLTFDWILSGGFEFDVDPLKFLTCPEPAKVRVRGFPSQSTEKEPADLLLICPVSGWDTDYIEKKIDRKITGPTFCFLENAETSRSFDPKRLPVRSYFCNRVSTIYQTLHPILFPSKCMNNEFSLPMGLQPGSGVFLDQALMEAPLSRKFCCPSYLPQIEVRGLREDILEAMDVFDSKSKPDFDQHSFNFGYAHHLASWGKFIDCVATHEKDKNVVIVLNQRGSMSDRLSTQEFLHQIFTPQRLSFLKKKGYERVICKGEEEPEAILFGAKKSQLGRKLTVVIRPSFAPRDMKRMQLASDRLLATGDNSAVESWCARCKLYLYEDVGNMGCKWRFLQQQVDLAQTISPNLSKLLALFGGDRRIPGHSLNKPFSREKMAEMEQLLNDPTLSDATFQFCNRITAKYSFQGVLEAALKRAAWHHYIPNLSKIEAETLDEEFRAGLVAYLKNPEAAENILQLRGIPIVIQESV